MNSSSSPQIAADPSQTGLGISYRKLAARHEKRSSGWLAALNIWLLIMGILAVATSGPRDTTLNTSLFNQPWPFLLTAAIICAIRYLRERRLCDYYEHRAGMMSQMQILIDQSADHQALRESFIQEAAREIARDPGLRK